MDQYRGVFRFMADTRDDLADAARTLDRLNFIINLKCFAVVHDDHVVFFISASLKPARLF
jgi:hypothetical protein